MFLFVLPSKPANEVADGRLHHVMPRATGFQRRAKQQQSRRYRCWQGQPAHQGRHPDHFYWLIGAMLACARRSRAKHASFTQSNTKQVELALSVSHITSVSFPLTSPPTALSFPLFFWLGPPHHGQGKQIVLAPYTSTGFCPRVWRH